MGGGGACEAWQQLHPGEYLYPTGVGEEACGSWELGRGDVLPKVTFELGVEEWGQF